MTTTSITGRKPLEAIWTRLVIDPVADRVVRLLVRRLWVTPNRVTLAAGFLAVCAAVAFGTGQLVVGAVAFQLRFLVDCLDGRLARLRGTATTWGGALDLIVDVVGITLSYAALATYVVNAGAAPPVLASAVIATSGVYMWTLTHRKSLPGGSQHDWLGEAAVEGGTPASRSFRGRIVQAMARHGMVPTPYAVEVEACVLTLAPLSVLVVPGHALAVVVACLWGATGFYVLASALNVYRTWRCADALDARHVRDLRNLHGDGTDKESLT
ncbi:CDP-alcohol phosphatidyltransferase family protein [Actinopolymorpha alba]|uniref:CDP-alcohol phosphatidyltransferase family protein n=1 Tax=Actinopolymorpha alba TaxID=533267 RepID=UPI00036BD38F|nr:CDP-alcohol phosphatidyltransferase family protein [Actinopolymorpha alba]